MRIKKLTYSNKANGWDLKTISFGPLTLLVGASGVGKTRILRSILELKKITRGASVNGAKWNVEFVSTQGNTFLWEGEFESQGFSVDPIFDDDDDDDDDAKDKPRIEREKIFVNGAVIIERDGDGILFKGLKTVKLSQNKSAMSLLKEEEQIKEAYQEFDKIIFDDNTNERLFRRFSWGDEIDEKLEDYQSIESIRDANEDVRAKLYFAYRNQRPVFDTIAQAFMEVFPHVEDVKVEPLTNGHKRRPRFLREMPFIQIKEKGIENWIDAPELSSGMYRTLSHIAEIYLCADSTLILIDEFENSLGINCIDELTTSIVAAERNLQFIITSHHPYIINNIGYAHWKIVTRKAGAVVVYDASDLNLDKSKHKAFTQLINLDIYEHGVDA